MLAPEGSLSDKKSPKFLGCMTLVVGLPSGFQRIPLTFEIEAKDITEAFRNFDQEAEKEKKRAEQMLREKVSAAQHPLIVPAGAIPEELPVPSKGTFRRVK